MPLDVCIPQKISYGDKQHTCIAPYYSKLRKAQRNLDALEPRFLVLEAVLGCENCTK